MLPADLPTTFTRTEALDLGLTDYLLTQLVRRGELRRIRNGVYAVPTVPSPEARSAACVRAGQAALATHRRAFAMSHLTAAAVFRLPLPLGPLDTVHLTGLEGSTMRTRRAPGLWVHHADSSQIDLVVVDDWLVTSPAQTVADCLRTFSPRVSVPIADSALHQGLTTPEDILTVVFQQCHWTGRVLRTDVALPLVDGRRESWLESYAAVRFSEWGMDLPVPQLVVLDEDERFVARTDGGWPEDATVMELDGKTKYLVERDGVVDPAREWKAEKDRFDAIGNLGLERVRFGLGHLLGEESLVQRRVRDRRRVGRRAGFRGTLQELPDTGLRLVA